MSHLFTLEITLESIKKESVMRYGEPAKRPCFSPYEGNNGNSRRDWMPEMLKSNLTNVSTI